MVKKRKPAPPVHRRCTIPGCPVVIPRKYLMCRPHWRKVPETLQALVWSTYVPGQEDTRRMTAAYLVAGHLAILAVMYGVTEEGKVDLTKIGYSLVEALERHGFGRGLDEWYRERREGKVDDPPSIEASVHLFPELRGEDL